MSEPLHVAPGLSAEGADDAGVTMVARRTIVSEVFSLTRMFNRALQSADVPVNGNREIGALILLGVDGPQRPRDLGASVGLSRAGTTGLVDRLEAVGAVARRPAEGDGRGVLVELTEDGVALLDRMAAAIRGVLRTTTSLVDGWKPQIEALGCELGPRAMPRGRTNVLRHTARLAGAGSTMSPVYESALGKAEQAPRDIAQVLLFATEPGGTRPGEISEATDLSSASTSDLLERMEKKGLVTRTTGLPPDRRVVFVEATEQGRTVLDTILRRADDTLRAVGTVLFPPSSSS